MVRLLTACMDATEIYSKVLEVFERGQTAVLVLCAALAPVDMEDRLRRLERSDCGAVVAALVARQELCNHKSTWLCLQLLSDAWHPTNDMVLDRISTHLLRSLVVPRPDTVENRRHIDLSLATLADLSIDIRSRTAIKFTEALG